MAAASPPPQIDPETIPSIPVHPESLQGIDRSRIYRQLGGGAPPRLISRKEVEYPPDHRPWNGQPGVLIVESVIAPDGRVAQMKVLRGPQDEIQLRALAEILKEWRFVPAKLKGEPVPVYYTFPIPVNTRRGGSGDR
jgi:TonB family protein